MVKHKLTGKVRHRYQRKWFGSGYLVVQVEVHVGGYQVIDVHGGHDINSYYWRDATIEDVSRLQLNSIQVRPD